MTRDLKQLYAGALAPYARKLECETLLREAEAATSLFDWGGNRWDEPTFRTRFAALCGSLESQARLSAIGRDRAHSRLHTMLCSRLLYVDWRSRHTEVDSRAITAPLIGTGLPRTGTTFLHNLLAQDPAHITPGTTDAAMPIPVPGDPGSEERVALYQSIMDFQGFTHPDVTAIHPYAATLPEECAYLHECTCPGMLYSAFFNVPDFVGMALPRVRDDYGWQVEQMKALQANRPGTRWALKGPPHILFWNELVGTFPDGKIYINHRDPGKVVPSIASLYMKARGLFSDDGSDPKQVGRAMLDAWSSSFDAVTQWRRAHPEMKIIDVHYLDLIAAPMATVERLYDEFGLDLTPATTARMADFLAIDHHAKAPKRPYGLADYGLDEQAIEAAFGGYIDHYGIQRERRV